MPEKINIPDYSGRKTFDFILEQVQTCIRDISPFFVLTNEDMIYNSDFLEDSKKYLTERPDIKLKEMAMCDIAYSIVFFGVSYFDRVALNRYYQNRYNNIFLSTLLLYISFKPHPDSGLIREWDSFNDEHLNTLIFDLLKKLEDERNNVRYDYMSNIVKLFSEHKLNDGVVFKYYGGHQFKLGHYYRHLYQTVKYIDQQKKLSYPEKYDHLKTLRAQLSTPEQYLLFFNSISSMGREWEFNKIKFSMPLKNLNCYLITKYNFIKNIPDTFFINLIEIKNYYPLIQFEFDTINNERREVERAFR